MIKSTLFCRPCEKIEQLKQNFQAFTLIEILLVISILGILAGVVLVATGDTRKSARDGRRTNDLSQVGRALQLYYLKYGSYPQTDGDGISLENDSENTAFVQALSNSSYMSVIPEDPGYKPGGEYSYKYIATTSDTYTLCARSEAQGDFFCTSQANAGPIRTPDVPVFGSWGEGESTAAVAESISIGSSGYHYCAVKTDGSAWCWGYNNYGQLGNNSGTANQLIPVQVVGQGGSGTLSGVEQVAEGYSHTCALKIDGTVWCWGRNNYGQLGDNSVTTRYAPVQVVGSGGSGTLSGVESISAGYSHTCALKSDNTVWCWGRNNYGQLGDNSVTTRQYPVQVVGSGGAGILSGAEQMFSVHYHSCVAKTDGSAWCWGYNNYGQLGDNSTTTRRYPVQVVGQGGSGTLSGVEQISEGYYHTCALKSDNTVWCWGYNNRGQLGDNSVTTRYTPVQVVGPGGSGTLSGAAQISEGYYHTCVLKSDNTVWCWGYNNYGQLGDNSVTTRRYPVQVVGSGGAGNLSEVEQTSEGVYQSCALKADGTVWCWGYNAYGQLGDNSTTTRRYPVQVLFP